MGTHPIFHVIPRQAFCSPISQVNIKWMWLNRVIHNYKLQTILILTSAFLANSPSYGATIDDIKQKLRHKSVEKQTGQKMDTKKGFAEAIGKYYIVEVKDMSRKDAESISQFMDKLMEEFLNLYDHNFGTRKCRVIIYGIKKDFDRTARKDDAENAKAYTYERGINSYIVAYYDEDLYSTLAHESFHVFIDNLFKRGVPIWFNEGMASYYETCIFINGELKTNLINEDCLQRARKTTGTKQWQKIKNLVNLSHNTFYAKNRSINYAESWCIIYYLKKKDEKAFKEFTKDLALGKSFSTALRSNYNIDPDELEKQLVQYINSI